MRAEDPHEHEKPPGPATRTARNEMKTVTRYEIRSYTGNGYSRAMFRALRDRPQAQRIARWLNNRDTLPLFA